MPDDQRLNNVELAHKQGDSRKLAALLRQHVPVVQQGQVPQPPGDHRFGSRQADPTSVVTDPVVQGLAREKAAADIHGSHLQRTLNREAEGVAFDDPYLEECKRANEESQAQDNFRHDERNMRDGVE